MSRRGDARAIYGAALRSVDAATAVQRALAARPPAGPVVVVGAGKAVRGMATGALQALGPRVLGGLVVAPAPAELGPIRVRVGDQDLGVGVVDEVTVDGGNAVWIFFPGSAPRRIPTDQGATEFTVLEFEDRTRR